MNRFRQLRHRSLMVGKYYEMLLGSTLSITVLSIVLLSDSVISGIMIDADAVVGVTLVAPIYSFASFMGSLASMGVPLLYNAEMGRFHRLDAERTFGMGIILAVGTGAALFILTSLFGDTYLKMCRPDVAVLGHALRYLRWMRFAILLLPVQMLMAGMVYADGDEVISSIASTTQGLGNVAASCILCRTMGIEGIALGTILFYAVSMLILAAHFLKKSNSLRAKLYFSLEMLKKMIRYSVIYSGEYLFGGLLVLSLSAFVSARFGARYLILVSAVNLCSAVQIIFEGVGEAISPIMSVYLGEDCLLGVRSIYAEAKKTTLWEGVAITAVLLLAAPLAPVLLGITDPELSALSIAELRILALSSFTVGMLYLTTAYYMVLDKPLLGFSIGMLRDFLAPALLAAALGTWKGIYGFFIGLMLAPLVSGLISMALLRMRYGGDAPLLLNQRETDREALLYDLAASPSAVVETRDLIGNALETRGYDGKTVNRVMLLFEEIFTLIREKNPGVDIQGECTLLLEGDTIRMVVRDTGVQFDPSNADMEVSSLSSYVISTVAERLSSRKLHLATMSFNRNMFELKTARGTE